MVEREMDRMKDGDKLGESWDEEEKFAAGGEKVWTVRKEVKERWFPGKDALEEPTGNHSSE